MALALVVALAATPGHAQAPAASRWEPGVVPALNYDSDIGFGFGAVGTLVRFEPGFEPYRLRLEAQLFTSVAVDEAGEPSLPFHDDYLRADAPGLFGDRLRLSGGVFFRKLASSAYYGIGQGVEPRVFSERELSESEAARRYHQYDHIASGADATARVTVLRVAQPGEDARLEWLVGLHGAFHEVRPYAESLLAEDAESIVGVGEHGLLSTDAGLLYDDRDHEFWPTRGSLTELSVRGSAGVGDHLHFLRAHLSTRWFAPLFGDALVFAQRAAVDLIAGAAPIYELTQFGVLDASDGPGGSESLRGVAMGLLAGKLKLVGNAELRAQAPWFHVAGEPFRVGFVGFVDAGRVWSELPPSAPRDGPWAPFDASFGGGLRLRWAETFILRADGAWSPTRATPGFYVDVGQVF